MNINQFIDFDNFVFLRGQLVNENTKLKVGMPNDRLINQIAVLDESSNQEFQNLSEDDRYRLDDFMWACIIESAVTGQEINEGLFKNIVKGVKDMSKKAVKYAINVVKNVGQLFKDLIKYVKAFLAATTKKAEEFGKSLWGEIKSQTEKKLAKKGLVVNEGGVDMKSASEELTHYNECREFVKSKVYADALKDGAEGGAETLKNAAKKSKSGGEQEEIMKRLKGQIKSEKKTNEDFSRNIITNAINEIRSDENFNISDLVSASNLVLEGGVEDAVDQKKSKFKSVTDSIQKVLAVLCSGIVYAFEQLVEGLINNGLNNFAKKVESFGGPKAMKYVSLGVIGGAIIGLSIELWATFSHPHGGALEAIADGLHHLNPSYLIGLGVNLIVPGAKTWIKLIAISIAVAIGAKHIYDGIKGSKDKKKESDEKEE